MPKLIIEKNLNKGLDPLSQKQFCIIKIIDDNNLLKDHFTFNLDYLFTYVKEGQRKKFLEFVLNNKGHNNLKITDEHLLSCVKLYFS
jgi:hypothetical protein